mgnify:FL=1
MEFVINEWNILNKVDNDYVVWGVYTFQTDKFLYMVMEYMQGGDLGHMLDEAKCLSEEST